MKAFKALLMLSMLMALAIALSATPDQEEPFIDEESNDVDETEETTTTTTTSLRGPGRFLATRPAVMTCDKYPRICRKAGSSGKDCCKKKCVDTHSDRVNCGMCGKKCKYAEICCKGKCVNPRSDKKNCGGCGNKCKKGSSCAYSMCSYA